jgi:hypothetical protein
VTLDDTVGWREMARRDAAYYAEQARLDYEHRAACESVEATEALWSRSFTAQAKEDPMATQTWLVRGYYKADVVEGLVAGVDETGADLGAA